MQKISTLTFKVYDTPFSFYRFNKINQQIAEIGSKHKIHCKILRFDPITLTFNLYNSTRFIKHLILVYICTKFYKNQSRNIGDREHTKVLMTDHNGRHKKYNYLYNLGFF